MRAARIGPLPGCVLRPGYPALGLAAVLAASAATHLRNPKFFYAVVPPVLCTDAGGRFGVLSRRQWVTLSAIPEAAAAVGLLIPAARKPAATATAVMFGAFTAGHLSALGRAFGPRGTPKTRLIHALRLPLQVPLILWAWRLRRS
ncbi:hypothetical protein [Arthrobacter sp. H14-L1]|uniref:DoxX family protein n=1 Tax=Arthrobacter sp. H14-L1 TaxID=2996697 RepID=UPI00226E972E|nr:hypothetical protein [Arthrobacter sp. H14-L1]MCY0904118.1 hypothetical protein [Arthrobacter sp. H14-L1]